MDVKTFYQPNTSDNDMIVCAASQAPVGGAKHAGALTFGSLTAINQEG